MNKNYPNKSRDDESINSISFKTTKTSPPPFGWKSSKAHSKSSYCNEKELQDVKVSEDVFLSSRNSEAFERCQKRTRRKTETTNRRFKLRLPLAVRTYTQTTTTTTTNAFCKYLFILVIFLCWNWKPSDGRFTFVNGLQNSTLKSPQNAFGHNDYQQMQQNHQLQQQQQQQQVENLTNPNAPHLQEKQYQDKPQEQFSSEFPISSIVNSSSSNHNYLNSNNKNKNNDSTEAHNNNNIKNWGKSKNIKKYSLGSGIETKSKTNINKNATPVAEPALLSSSPSESEATSASSSMSSLSSANASLSAATNSESTNSSDFYKLIVSDYTETFVNLVADGSLDSLNTNASISNQGNRSKSSSNSRTPPNEISNFDTVASNDNKRKLNVNDGSISSTATGSKSLRNHHSNATSSAHNNNHNNRSSNADTPLETIFSFMDNDNSVFNLHDELLDSFRSTHSLPHQPTYTNEFAVHIPAGKDIADIIASKHGFENMGQIGSLKDYYLFHHRRVAKRSVNLSQDHHFALNGEPAVRWLEQQHIKRRKKRDGSYPTIAGYKPFEILRPSSFEDDSRVNPRLAYHSSATRPLLSRGSRIEYREVGPHNIFPDPLFKEQWYLNGGAKDGLDMNIAPAWQKGYTGKGVVVSILDDGIQTNHPDLAQNYDPDASFDINGNDSDPTPQDNGDNKHGTRCAGEVAAVAFNNYCGVGVAYNSSIGGVRMLDGKVNDVVEAQALSLNPSHIDIYSASWGPEDDGSTVDGPGPLARRAFIYGVTSGRQGKGSIFVWASGNGGRYTDSCNCDGYTNSIFTLSISSATQGGFKPWYLEECSSTLATTYSSGTPGHDKSVATVDMDGRLRPDHICTVEHTGTSASAPLAAGICALALEANPNLTWRDMQYLVVYTSRPGPLEKESGWSLNGVKRKFSHKFGYGLMDAGAMVSLAEQWSTVPPQHICKSRENNEDRKIDSSFGYTLTTHMDVNGCAGTINEVRYLEHVQCRITLRFFPRGNLRLLLTSPMGTTSTLLFERPRDIVKSNFDDWPFLSVHFWGEKAEGRWTLQVTNSGRRRVNQPGILSKWQLIFYGTATQPMRLKSEILNQRTSAPLSPFAFPTASDLGQSANEGGIFGADQYSGYLSYQNLFTAAGSSPEQAIATVDGHNIPTPQRENVMADSNNKLVLHDCDPECDYQGCYGRGPTQCVACKHYRLDNTCVSRCPPRSFPNQGGVCWPCHESCETCAGAGQDSCLTCAPAHLHVTDLAVCLQVCPDGYYENYDNKTCVPCEANCASCQDRPDYCTSCQHHLVMHEHKCYSACPLHTYETEDYKSRSKYCAVSSK